MQRWTWQVRLIGLIVALGGAGQVGAQEEGPPAAVPESAPAQVTPGSLAVPPSAPLERVIAVDLEDVTLEHAVREIARLGGVKLSYSADVVDLSANVSLHAKRITVGDALRAVLRGRGVEVRALPSGQVMLVRAVSQAPVSPNDSLALVGGRVTVVGTGEPLAGAIVSIADTSLTLRAITRDNGGYVILRVPRGERVITARRIGYRPVTRTISVDSAAVEVNLALEPAPARLEELVTTATGQQRRVELGNAISTIRVDSVMQTAPIQNVTDLLETRVPGLVTQPTSGVPGDPTRLRLRGVSSPFLGNDPIVIVDGVRIYYSGESFSNLANGEVPAPSALDQIDPNSIETIEVFKGPSAATLYGADAANGVIVITTKRGRAGPAQWTASLTHGRTRMPGAYPEGYYRWGTSIFGGNSQPCPLTDLTCVQDSLVRFQALNDPELTVLDEGHGTDVSLGVSGGTLALQYAVRGTFGEDIGLVRLPGIEADRFRERVGREVPDWMQRPHRLKTWGGSSTITARLGPSASVDLTTALVRQEQQRSSLERQLGTLMTTYVDKVNGLYYRGGNDVQDGSPDFVTEYYQRTTASAINFTNGLTAKWQPLSWLDATAQAGINVISLHDEMLVPRQFRATEDSTGQLNLGSGRRVEGTVNLQASAQAPIDWGFTFRTTVGANYTSTSTEDLYTHAEQLVDGTNSLNGAGLFESSQGEASTATFGWFIEPTIAHKRFFLSTGLRLDGGNTYGTRVSLASFPKLSASWLISDEPFFPLKSFFSSLRLRAAYGQAGVQPRATDRLRLFEPSRKWVNGQFVDAAELTKLGNTQLRPERSTEFEGGFEADLFDDRFRVEFTAYRKTQVDALMQVPLAPSVYGGGAVLRNIGTIRNTGIELTVGLTPVRTRAVTWDASLYVSQNRNRVVELGRGVEPFETNAGALIAAGYPLFGRWARPIVGYDDVNRDGIILANEVRLGDSLVYMGSSQPDYQTSLHTNLRLFDGALAVGASFDYQDGLTQVNEVVKANQPFSRALNDPSAPLGEQAAVAVMNKTDYGLMQTVSTLRFNTLSVRYRVPQSLARALGAADLSLAVQGRNLGLHTNYSGLDPQVNASTTGHGVVDAGLLPQPREWSVRLDVRY